MNMFHAEIFWNTSWDEAELTTRTSDHSSFFNSQAAAQVKSEQ